MIRLFPIFIILGLTELAEPVTAAPVSVSYEDFQLLERDLSALSSAPSEKSETPELPAALPPIAVVHGLRTVAGSTSSTSTSLSLTTGSGGAAASLLSSRPLCPSLIESDLQPADRLLIPLRFLDGVFRPPEELALSRRVIS